MRKSTHAPRYSAALIGSIAGLRKPDAEYRFHPDRKWRFDFAWPEARIAYEIEGAVWTGGRHTRGSGFIKDAEKYNHAAALDWLVFRIDSAHVYSPSTLALVAQAYRARCPDHAKSNVIVFPQQKKGRKAA